MVFPFHGSSQKFYSDPWNLALLGFQGRFKGPGYPRLQQVSAWGEEGSLGGRGSWGWGADSGRTLAQREETSKDSEPWEVVLPRPTLFAAVSPLPLGSSKLFRGGRGPLAHRGHLAGEPAPRPPVRKCPRPPPPLPASPHPLQQRVS
jgi:hypothetical protein